MPTVPYIDQTASAAPEYSAPGVAPVRNAAPELQQALGRTVEQGGGVAFRTGQTIGDALAEQVDDARVSAGLSAALSSTSKLLNDPESGYLHKLNQDAMESYGPTKEAAVKAFTEQKGSLTNPIQQHMFQQKMDLHLLDIGKQIDDHNAVQTRGFATSAAKDAADSHLQLALRNSGARGRVDYDGNDTGPYAANVLAMQAQLLRGAQLNGLNPDSPQAKALVRDQMSQLNKAVILRQLDDHKVGDAKKTYDEAIEGDGLSLNDIETLGSVIKGETDRQAGEDGTQTYATKAITGGGVPVTLAPILTTGSASFAGQTEDDRGLNYAAPANSDVMSPADGKVAGILHGDQGSLAVQIEFPNGSTAVLAGLSATQVKRGDAVRAGDAVGVSGGEAVHYTLRDAKGSFVDPRSASEPQPDLSAMADPNVWRKAVDAAQDGPEAPQIKKRIISGLDAMHGYYSAMASQAAAERYSQAGDHFYSGGMRWKAIPSSLFNQLTPEQQQHFVDLQTSHVLERYNQSQAFKMMSEVDIVSDLYANPEKITTANVELARPQLANSTYLSLMNRAQDQQRNPGSLVEAQGVAERIKYYAARNGMKIEGKQTPEDKQQYIDLTKRVLDDIDQIKTVNKGKATADQVDKAIQQQLIRQTVGDLPHKPWNPLVLFHMESNAAPQRYNFQMPSGATRVAPGADGAMHYTNEAGTVDLGVVQ